MTGVRVIVFGSPDMWDRNAPRLEPKDRPGTVLSVYCKAERDTFILVLLDEKVDMGGYQVYTVWVPAWFIMPEKGGTP